MTKTPMLTGTGTPSQTERIWGLPGEGQADALVQVLSLLCSALPTGAALAVSWRDEVLGTGGMAMPEASPALRRRASQALEGIGTQVTAEGLVLAWTQANGSVCIAVAATFAPAMPEVHRQAWCKLARMLMGTALDNARAQVRIASLEKSKRLQQALYEIADLAGGDLEVGAMLRCVHRALGTLMYAENCYIVLYDESRDTIRFLYFSDQKDQYVADPECEISTQTMANSMTLALLRHGQALRGPSQVIRQKLGVEQDARWGPDSLDWLGVPMRYEDRVCGAIVVQSYELPSRYTDEERAMLGYVAQHILTALDRKYAYVELERRVALRTHELQRANDELQAEIAERKRAQKLQAALFRIAELAFASESIERFYADVHAVVGELIDASNFYIALLSEDGQTLSFPYSIDERDSSRPARQMGNGLTEWVLRTGQALLADRQVIDRLVAEGNVVQHGPPAYSWLGVPLFHGGQVLGVVVVQSYSPKVGFTRHDQRLLAFVAHNIGNGLIRKRAQERLRMAHAELERRVDERTRELAETNVQLRAQINERLRAEQRLTHQATHDALTGLPNRSHLLDRLAAAIERARHGDGQEFAVLFMDLDRFKRVNDSIGHAAGDELLIEVARRISLTVSQNDMVARLGGDEFAILMQYGDGDDRIRELPQRLLSVLSRPLWVAGRELYPSASLGVAMWHPRYRNGEELLRDADVAMYQAKKQGRDRHAMFDEAMREAVVHGLDLQADLRRAIHRGDFVPYYQPIVRLSDGQVVGHEAVLRWQHERRGLLEPAEFMTMREDSGLIEQIDWLLYEQVVRQMAQREGGYVSINVSQRHFRSPEFAERLLELFDVLGGEPARLRVEITEQALLDDPARSLRILTTLRQRGVLAQLNDFGTGFSGVSCLHRFPISVVKIDRSFIAGMGDDEHSGSPGVVHAMLALARTLGIDTLAEGVETELQRKVLRELGCNFAKGYLLGQPRARMELA